MRQQGRNAGLLRSLVLAAACGVAADAHAADRHLGVADCAGSTCHGATRPFADRRIRQDEYFIWQRQDAHAGAYRTLLGERSRRIAGRLGLAAAERAPECLACHAQAPVAAERGPRFLVEDGIGCEACHGAAERWIGPHAEGLKTAADKTRLGMFPTWEPEARAALCLSCHQGDATHVIDHRIMAAGHPPLLFELDTFQALMPPHHVVDADYIARKGRPDPARQWLAGQLIAADRYLARLEGGGFQQGVFPELELFDCDACHHSMQGRRERAGRMGELPPGTVPLADGALVMLDAWLPDFDAALAGRWRAALAELRRQTAAGPAALQARAGEMRGLLTAEIQPQASSAPAMTGDQLRGVLTRVLTAAQSAHAGDYLFAEQTAMAVQVLGDALAQRDGRPRAALRSATDGLYEAVRNRDRFDPAGYRKAAARVERALR